MYAGNFFRTAGLLVLALVAGCEDVPEPAPPPRVLVVGWDGASFRHIDPLLAAGELPNLAALIQRGTRAPLVSTRIPISSAAWTTATTGKGSGEHGVFGFHEPLPGSYDLTLVSSRSVRSAPLWRLLTARGLPSFVFGVPVTYPPEPLLGTMVCGMLSPPDADYAWPRELAGELRARGYLPDLDPWLEEREPTLDEALAQLELRRELLPELLARDDWRLAWIVFKELDVLSHFSYGLDFAQHVRPLYLALDRILGTLLASLPPGTDVLVVSDHGFTSYTRGFNLHAWLVQEGFAVRRSDSRDEPLPEGPFAQSFAAEANQRLAALELARSEAFAWTSEGNFGSVRLNLAGREPAGIVHDPKAVLARLEARLRAHHAVVNVWRASELLAGPRRESSPDLIFETAPEVQVFAELGSPLEGTYEPSVADHDLYGIFAAAGPRFAPGAEAGTLSLLELAPLTLHLLGLPVPHEMRGRVPRELLRDATPETRVPEATFGAHLPVRTGSPYSPEELRALEESLRALGYGD